MSETTHLLLYNPNKLLILERMVIKEVDLEDLNTKMIGISIKNSLYEGIMHQD